MSNQDSQFEDFLSAILTLAGDQDETLAEATIHNVEVASLTKLANWFQANFEAATACFVPSSDQSTIGHSMGLAFMGQDSDLGGFETGHTHSDIYLSESGNIVVE
jgi:hypothetical protein